MQVHLIKKVSIELYCIQNAQSRNSFEAWLTKLKFAVWQIPADIRMDQSALYLILVEINIG
jgi:mRNA interferase HigB